MTDITEIILRKLSQLGCDMWEMTEKHTKSREFYFIRHRLDQDRLTDVTALQVKVYIASEDNQYLGSASGEIPPTASEKEIDKILSDLKFQAGLVKNPYYTLQDVQPEVTGDLPEIDSAGIAKAFMQAIRSVPETGTEDINSYEIFVREITRRYRNSHGLDVTCRWPDSMAEIVVNARKDEHEIELYRNLTSGTCDADRICDGVRRAMQYGKDRLLAQPTPEGLNCPVVFTTSDAVSIYEFFTDRMNAGLKVRKLSGWEAGKPITETRAEGSGTTGDPVTLEALPFLPNSSANVPVDAEGSRIRERRLISEGVAENFWGDRQFSCYLGLTDSSMVYNFRVSGGTLTEEEWKKREHLEIVEFSDFQVDAMSGDIAGEIRLAYWRHDGVTEIVTGGSVSGQMPAQIAGMRFSREAVQYDNWEIPAVTMLPSLAITGCR